MQVDGKVSENERHVYCKQCVHRVEEYVRGGIEKPCHVCGYTTQIPMTADDLMRSLWEKIEYLHRRIDNIHVVRGA